MTPHPFCIVCHLPVIAGQVDGRNRPAHLGCQPCLDPADRHLQLATWATCHGTRWALDTTTGIDRANNTTERNSP